MVRQHSNPFAIPKLFATIVPTLKGWEKFKLELPKIKPEDNILGYDPAKPCWNEVFVGKDKSMDYFTDSTISIPIESWSWETFFPKLHSRPMHIVGN